MNNIKENIINTLLLSTIGFMVIGWSVFTVWFIKVYIFDFKELGLQNLLTYIHFK